MSYQVLPQEVTLLSSICPDVFDEKIKKSLHEALPTLTKTAKYCENLKRKDYRGKLKEVLSSKTYTYPFVLKSSKDPNLLILQPVGQKSSENFCVFPPELEETMQVKDFFTEGEVYVFSSLAICVAEEPESTVFYCITPATKVRSIFNTRPIATKNSLQISSALSFLTFDISAELPSPVIPSHFIRRFKDRMLTVKGYVAEVKQSENQYAEQYNSNHSTWFLKLYHETCVIDEIKIFVKIYEEKLVKFRQTIAVGSLVEINNIKQYFSNEMNFIYRSDYRPECYKVTPKNDDFDLKFDAELSFKQRLRIVNLKEPMQPTLLSKLPPMHLVRQTLKLIVDLESVLMLEITMKCYACRNKSNYCCCEEPNLKMNTFCLLLAKQADTVVYITFKDYDVLCSFLDVSAAEQDATVEFLKKSGDLKVVNGDVVGLKSYERKKIASYFNKYISKKGVYGTFQSKREKEKPSEEDVMLPDYMKKDPGLGLLFGNGTIKNKPDDNTQILSYCFTAHFSEKVPAVKQVGGILNSIFSMI